MTLESKIESSQARVGVIGLGYVGLPLLHAFHAAGFPVLGFDVDPRKIAALHRGENYLKHLGTELVSNMLKAGGGRFDATADMGRLGEMLAGYDCVLISTHHSSYDWQQVADHARLIVDTRNALKGLQGPGGRDHIFGA